MNITEKVTEIIKNLCGAKSIEMEDKLVADLAMDSLSMVSLLVELEDGFQITFLESDMNPFELNTVADVVALVTKYEEGNNG